MNRRSPSETILSDKRTRVTFPLTSRVLKKTHFTRNRKISKWNEWKSKEEGFVHRATYCARNDPLPLLPSGPGGVGGITSRRTRHMS
jgi:hypothetical protein